MIQDGTSVYESPQEEVTEEIWKRILANLPSLLSQKEQERAVKGIIKLLWYTKFYVKSS